MRDVLAKMRECWKDVKIRDFPHDWLTPMPTEYALLQVFVSSNCNGRLRTNTSDTVIQTNATLTQIFSDFSIVAKFATFSYSRHDLQSSDIRGILMFVAKFAA